MLTETLIAALIIGGSGFLAGFTWCKMTIKPDFNATGNDPLFKLSIGLSRYFYLAYVSVVDAGALTLDDATEFQRWQFWWKTFPPFAQAGILDRMTIIGRELLNAGTLPSGSGIPKDFDPYERIDMNPTTEEKTTT